MKLVLVYFSEGGERRDIQVRSGRCVIGRKPTCELQIPLPEVSREHCSVRIEGGKALVKDLGSSNGTFRNDHRLTGEEPLGPGDRLSVGAVQLTVQIDGEPTHVEPPLLDSPTVLASRPAPVGVKTESARPGAAAAPITKKVVASEEHKSVLHDSGEIADLIAKSGGEDSSVFDFDFGDGDSDEPGKRSS